MEIEIIGDRHTEKLDLKISFSDGSESNILFGWFFSMEALDPFDFQSTSLLGFCINMLHFGLILEKSRIFLMSAGFGFGFFERNILISTISPEFL